MSEEENAKVCKVVLIGESSVGKTCIIYRFINDSFDINEPTSNSASFVSKIFTDEAFNGESIKYDIWDTVGQEKYRALARIFYKDASVAILVYDITKKATFEEIKNYWYNQIKENAPSNTNKS